MKLKTRLDAGLQCKPIPAALECRDGSKKDQSMRLLLVEDDRDLSTKLQAQLSSAQLSKQGYAVDAVDNGIDAEHFGLEESYDIAILDLGLPDKPGLEVLRNWRTAERTLPVIILTARDQWYNRVDGFKAGADDYLGKPFHFEELLERIRALIRRNNASARPSLNFGVFTLDEDRQELCNSETREAQPLTGVEFRL